MSRSLVTFCRSRKSLALRRNRSRALRDRPPDAERKQRGRGKPLSYLLRMRRGVPDAGAVYRRAATWGLPYGKSGTLQHAFPRRNDHPREAPCRRERKVSSISYGRQQAGAGRVGSRSAGFRGRQGAGFDGKEIFKDHGSLSRSLVTFCRSRKSLALRRNRRRSFRKRPPDAGRDRGPPGVIEGRAPYTKIGRWVGIDKSLRRNRGRTFRKRPPDAGRDRGPAGTGIVLIVLYHTPARLGTPCFAFHPRKTNVLFRRTVVFFPNPFLCPSAGSVFFSKVCPEREKNLQTVFGFYII